MSTPLSPQTREELLEITARTYANATNLFNSAVTLRRRLSVVDLNFDVYALNVAELVYLLLADTAVLLNDMISHQPDFRANLYGRVLILTLHESSLTLRSLLGPRFRTSYALLVTNPAAETQLKACHSDICHFFERSNTMFGDVRDGIVGHRDQNAEIRATLLETADIDKVAKLAAALFVILTPLLAHLNAYIEALGDRLYPTAT